MIGSATGWTTAKIGDVTIGTQNRDPSKLPNKPFRYVDVSSVSNERFKIVSAIQLLGKDAPSRARKEIRSRDILFATVRPTLKRVALVPQELDGEIASTGYCVLRPDSNTIVPEFLYLFLLTDGFIARMGSLERGASYPAVRDSDILSSVVPLPPFEEQRRIAYVLGTIQTAIEQQSQLVDLMSELKAALLAKLFTKGAQGEEQKATEIGMVPASWEVVELQQVAEKPQYGFTESARDTGNVRFLRITDIQDFGVCWDEVPHCDCPEEVAASYLLSDGDLVFARIGATTGKSLLVKSPPKAVFASYLIRVRPNIKKMDPAFLGFYCQTSQYWRQIDAYKGANLKGGVNSGILQRLLVPLPSLVEQQEIASTLSTLDYRIKQAHRRKALLVGLFQTLLHQLMGPEFRVGELELPMEVTHA